MAQLRRRTLLLCGAVGALAVGGGIAVSRAHKPSYPPLGPGPDLDNLPVAEVPAPTDEPVEVVYCAGWDAATRAPVSPMAESVARAQDAAGAQWAAVLFVGGVARTVVEVCWSAHYAELWHIDDAGRRFRGVSYRRWPDERLRLFHVRSWNYAGPDTPERDGDEPTFEARVSRDATAAIERVEIDVFRVTENGSPATALSVACRLTVTDRPITSWHLALREGDHELALGDGEFFGNSTDGATLALVDRAGATAYERAEIEAVAGSTEPYQTLSAEGTDMVIVRTQSDGSFPTWLGRTEDGAIGCYVLDFLMDDMDTAQPG